MEHLDLRDPDHAYFFGFFQTDGHLSRGRGRKGTASIELSARDASILIAFSTLFAPELRSQVSYRTRSTNFAEHHVAATWTAHDMGFRDELVRLGVPVGRKSVTVAPPTGTFDRRSYLRGLVDGDGSIGFTARGRPFVGFTTASSAMKDFFCFEIYEITGAARSIRRNTRDGVFNGMVTMESAATLAAWLYPPACLALERKHRIAKQVASWTRPATMRPPHSRRSWTSEEDQVALSMPIRVAAEQLGRSVTSVNVRRWRLRQTQEPIVD